MNTIVVLLLTVITVPNSPYSLCRRKATLNLNFGHVWNVDIW